MSVEALAQPASGSPVVALALILLVVAVMSVLLVSWLFYWRGGRR